MNRKETFLKLVFFVVKYLYFSLKKGFKFYLLIFFLLFYIFDLNRASLIVKTACFTNRYIWVQILGMVVISVLHTAFGLRK